MHSRHDNLATNEAIHEWNSEAKKKQDITEARSVTSVTLHSSRYNSHLPSMVERCQAPTFRDIKILNPVYHSHQQIQGSNGLCCNDSKKNQKYIANTAQRARGLVQNPIRSRRLDRQVC